MIRTSKRFFRTLKKAVRPTGKTGLSRTYQVMFLHGLSTSPKLVDLVLLENEPAIETDTTKWKIGDGVTRYHDLPYQPGVLPSYTFTIKTGRNT